MKFLQIIHTDLKPENVLVSARTARILVPDGPWTETANRPVGAVAATDIVAAEVTSASEMVAGGGDGVDMSGLSKKQKKRLRQKLNRLSKQEASTADGAYQPLLVKY